MLIATHCANVAQSQNPRRFELCVASSRHKTVSSQYVWGIGSSTSNPHDMFYFNFLKRRQTCWPAGCKHPCILVPSCSIHFRQIAEKQSLCSPSFLLGPFAIPIRTLPNFRFSLTLCLGLCCGGLRLILLQHGPAGTCRGQPMFWFRISLTHTTSLYSSQFDKFQKIMVPTPASLEATPKNLSLKAFCAPWWTSRTWAQVAQIKGRRKITRITSWRPAHWDKVWGPHRTSTWRNLERSAPSFLGCYPKIWSGMGIGQTYKWLYNAIF